MPPTTDASNVMFHTFQGLAPLRLVSEPAQDPPNPQVNGVAKRITTSHACAECKRRKIRCDGRQPCGQCIGCRSPKPCYYDKHRQRVIPSRKTLDALQQSLDEYRSILERLFPTRDAQSLLNLSRQDLIALLDRECTTTILQSSPTISQSSVTSQDLLSSLVSTSDDDQSLANLEQIPSQDTEWDEERRYRDPIPLESDDVNALSLSIHQKSSYLGVSSIKAAFLVMLKLAPRLRSFLVPPTKLNQASNHSTRPRAAPRQTSEAQSSQILINAYFNHIQIVIPMLDEPSFRKDYLNGQRNDPPWLALLNMVFAMGSIAAMKSDDCSHIKYYDIAKEYLGVDGFGSGRLETLQAYALMGGYYLHYVNRPNMANSIMGAALRMACALGLHREYIRDSNTIESSNLAADLRRRTWWSMFCLDTWASTPLGRPSLGRWGRAITIQPPKGIYDANENSTTSQNIKIVPLIENIKLCQISTQIQDILALTPLPSFEERNSLDSQLDEWAENLPWILRSTDQCSEALYTARCLMKWRYQNLRIVLHRPVLLNLANRGRQNIPSPAEKASVEKCRSIAKQTIEDITQEWARNQFSGWHAAWLLYQAAMIPLLSIFWENCNTARLREWQSQLEMVIESLGEMTDWSLAAGRSKEVVSIIYEASRKLATRDGNARLNANGPSNEPLDVNPNGNTNGDVLVKLDGMANEDHSGLPSDAQLSETGEAYAQQHGHMDTTMWDLDTILWGSVPDRYEMSFDGIPDISFDGIPEIHFGDSGQETYGGSYRMHG